MVEFLKMMEEHTKTHNEHSEFYEMAEKYNFCTPWCHLDKLCNECEEKCSTE